MKNIDIWRKGTPLQDAIFRFAPQRLWEAYNREPLKEPDVIGGSVEGLNKTQRDMVKALDQMSQFFSHSSARYGIHIEMQEWLLRALADGRLSAFGFLVEATPTDEPVGIPPYMFVLNFIDWKNATLKGLGREYVSARVIRPRRNAVGRSIIQPDPTSAISPRRPIGRPTQRDNIVAAIRALQRDGVDFNQGTTKEHAELVRQQIGKLTGRPTEYTKGLTDETIRRLISHYRSPHQTG